MQGCAGENSTVRPGRGGALTMIQKSETLDTDLRGLMPPGLENNPMDTLLVPKGTVADKVLQFAIGMKGVMAHTWGQVLP